MDNRSLVGAESLSARKYDNDDRNGGIWNAPYVVQYVNAHVLSAWHRQVREGASPNPPHYTSVSRETFASAYTCFT